MKPDYKNARVAHLTPEAFYRVRSVFEAAIQRDPEERHSFVDEMCPDDPPIAAEAHRLIDAWNEDAGAFVGAGGVARTLPARDASATAGQVIGPYLIRDEIGRGGMGVVYLAEDTRLSRRVALKAIHPALVASPEQRERLRREARAAAALSHPGIATVYALEEIDGALYLASEFVPGRTVRMLLQERTPLPPEVFIDTAAQVARVLAAAHAQGIVHRDLKPENVMRTSAGVVKVLDFGVARWEGSPASRLTNTGAVVGTPAYMAPEQLRDEPIDFRADLFAFGVLLYEMASGTNPFEGSTLPATVGNILQLQPAPLSECGRGNEMLDRIVDACLAKQPADRYQSTGQLVADLESLAGDTSQGQNVRAPRRPSSERDSREIRRSKPAVTARWWWDFHQLIVSAIYVLMIYPAWRARVWMPADYGMPFFFAVLISAAVTTALRLNLRFTARLYPGELPAQRARATPWIRGGDTGFALTLLLGAVAIASEHPEIGTLFVTTAVVSLVASYIIEPTTTRAAFRKRSSTVRTAAKRDG
jgi:serine/threonine protein kinase